MLVCERVGKAVMEAMCVKKREAALLIFFPSNQMEACAYETHWQRMALAAARRGASPPKATFANLYVWRGGKGGLRLGGTLTFCCGCDSLCVLRETWRYCVRLVWFFEVLSNERRALQSQRS